MLRIGTANWAIPRACSEAFPHEGSSLQRYSARFSAVEVNSTFHKLPRPATITGWAAQVPIDFLFAVKMPRSITHEGRLAKAGILLPEFLSIVRLLGPKLGPLLVQLPPSLAFDKAIVHEFLCVLRSLHGGPVVLEPRNATWFNDELVPLMVEHRIARVAADPPCHAEADVPAWWPKIAYFRLHGSPKMYYSQYGPSAVARFATSVLSLSAAESWCVFDNTASGAAAQDALCLAQFTAKSR